MHWILIKYVISTTKTTRDERECTRKFIPSIHRLPKVKDDYKGFENLYAAVYYGGIQIGKMITFIPGVRYDYSYCRLHGIQGRCYPRQL